MDNGDELRGAALGLAHGPLYRQNGHAKRAMDVGNPGIYELGRYWTLRLYPLNYPSSHWAHLSRLW